MRKHLMALCATVALFLFLFIGCNKSDNHPDQPSPVQISQNDFFSLPKGVDPSLTGIAKKIGEQNEKRNFLPSLIRRVGYPRWEYALIAESPTSTRHATRQPGETGSQKQIIYIPFAKETEQKTKAILRVTIDGSNQRFQMLYPQQFDRFGFQESNAKGWNAKDLFYAFANFDYEMFGTTQYLLMDGRIAGRPKKDWITINRAASNSSTTEANRFVEASVCNTWTSCVYATSAPDDGGSCVTTTQCVSYWYDDGVGGGTSSDPSGGGGGSSDPGDSGWPDDPCTPALARNAVPDGGTNPPADPPACDPESWLGFGTEAIPCKSSFNFVKQGNWQSAVITDYRFTFRERRTGKEYTITIGNIEVGMPYSTYLGSIIPASTAQAMSAQAASLAEGEVMQVVAAQVIVAPNSPLDNQHYKNLFKEIYLFHLNMFLRDDFYNGQQVAPAKIYYDNSSFALKDPTQYRTLKFWGRDC